MEEWSYPEYLIRLRWLDDQWNKPDRRSYEIARIAQRVIQVAVKPESQSGVKLEDQMVKFNLVRPGGEAKKLPPLELMKLPPDHPQVIQAKVRWNAIVNPPKKVQRGQRSRT